MKKLDKLTMFLITMLIIVIILGYFAIKSSMVDTYTIVGTVEQKWIDYGNEESHYLLRLDGNRMIEVQRNAFYSGKEYNSDIIFSDINVNETYRFTCYGWQYDWAGIYWYPNIIGYVEINEE